MFLCFWHSAVVVLLCLSGLEPCVLFFDTVGLIYALFFAIPFILGAMIVSLLHVSVHTHVCVWEYQPQLVTDEDGGQHKESCGFYFTGCHILVYCTYVHFFIIAVVIPPSPHRCVVFSVISLFW